jgi:hypothetical protein
MDGHVGYINFLHNTEFNFLSRSSVRFLEGVQIYL